MIRVQWSVVVMLVAGACAACQPRGSVASPRAAASLSAPRAGGTVKVATVHFAPEEGNVQHNREQIVALSEQAAQNGAKIVVHTEMATSGYSFFSRQEIASVAETIPGPSTEAVGEVARRHGIYIVFGMPERDVATNLYYNSAVLVGPTGNVLGVYRKRNNLLEASYNAELWAPVPTFDTPYGRLAIVICSDMFYAIFPRLAAVAGADILLAPANVGVEADFARVRTWENNLAMVIANRFGKGGKGSKQVYFNQDSFAIPSPFPYDFSYGSRSLIMTNTGQLLADITGDKVQVGYGELPIRDQRTLPVVRRPMLYSLIGQDTLESYTFSQFGLPAPTVFAMAGVDPGPNPQPWSAALAAVQHALEVAKTRNFTLRLVALPAGYFAASDPSGMASLQGFASANQVDIFVGFGGVVPTSTLIASDGHQYGYTRTHRLRDEHIPDGALSPHYQVVDRDYARVALLQDVDLLVPETSLVLEKLGVDVVVMGSNSTLPVLGAIWKSRTADYYSIVQANRQGPEGVYAGGYPPGDPFVEADGLAMMQIDTKYVRNKKFARFADFTALVRPCGGDNC